MAHGEVGNGEVKPHLRMATTFAEGSISLLTAWTTRADPGVMAIMAQAGVAEVVPFWQRPCQRQGRQTLHTPKGQSLQVGESMQLTSKEVHSCSSVKAVCDRVFYNSATCVPVTSTPVCPAVSSGDYLSCDVTQMPSGSASAELGKLAESHEQSEQWSQP